MWGERMGRTGGENGRGEREARRREREGSGVEENGRREADDRKGGEKVK